MKEHGTKQAAGTQEIETPGGGYTLKRDEETQMNVNAHAALPSVNSHAALPSVNAHAALPSVNAHAALPSRFAMAGGFFNRPVEPCPSSRVR